MKLSTRFALCGLTMLGTAVSAMAGDSPQTVTNANESWGVWGPAKVDFPYDPAVQGGVTKRVTISPKPDKAWDIGAYAAITKPVQKGDVLLLTFWARAEKTPIDNDFILASGRIHENAPPDAGVTPETSFLIGKQWKAYYAAGTATKDYPAGTLSVGMVLGSGEQVIAFGPMSVLDYGQGYDQSKLPHN